MTIPALRALKYVSQNLHQLLFIILLFPVPNTVCTDSTTYINVTHTNEERALQLFVTGVGKWTVI